MLTIGAEILEAIVAHARRDHPSEACGLVAGPAGLDQPLRHIPMINAAHSTIFYEFDPGEYLSVWRDMDAKDEDPVVIYHSHTATPAYPSATDAGIAGWPEAHYLLISTRDQQIAELRSFRIVDGAVTEEPIRLAYAPDDPPAVQSYRFGHNPVSVEYECRA